MSNSSNQIGSILLVLILLAVVFIFTFKNSDAQLKNASTSLYSSSTRGATNGRDIENKFDATSYNSNLVAANLPSYKNGSGSTAIDANASEVAFPSSSIAPVNLNETSVSISGAPNLRNQVNIANTTTHFISNSNASGNEINTSFMLIQAHNAQSTVTPQASKRLIKTDASSSSSTNEKGKQKSKNAPGDPGDPGVGGSLPVGDGVWIMLIFAGFYGMVILSIKQTFLKTKNI